MATRILRELHGFAVALGGLEFQVTYSPEAILDETWIVDFTKDSEAKRDVLIARHESVFDICAYKRGASDPVTEHDIAAASQALCEAAGVKPGTEVQFRCDREARTATVDPGAARITSRYAVLLADSLDAWIARDNQLGLENLVAQLSSSMGVIPFVGAGMSAKFGFPQWGEFFQSAAEGHPRYDEIADLVERGQYLDAAEILHASDPDALQLRIKHTFSREVPLEELSTGAISVLPVLATGPVITTNFDRVLEDAFRAASRPFETVIPGIQVDNIVRAIHRNERALLKIHGDCMDRTFRTFSRWEYDRSYAPSDPRQPNLSSLAWLMFTNRPLLFLGCSLDADRTTDVLAEVHQRLGAVSHYAIVAAPYEAPRRVKRAQVLQRCGVTPIWFRPRRFEAISDLLMLAVQRSASQPLRPPAPPRKVALAAPPSGQAARAAFGGILEGDVEPEPTRLPPSIYGRIARAIIENKAIFFLGAYAHLGALPIGDRFYSDLADKYRCPDLRWDRAAVARYILDQHGPKVLWREISSVLATAHIDPSLAYRFLAALPGFLRATRPEEPAVIIFTTNYDTMLERVFAAANEPFHLLYYQGEGQLEGVFIHRGPMGSLARLNRPANIRQLPEPGSIIVKMNGGLRWDPGIPESVLIARGDFERLAGRLPEVLPAVLRSALRERSLLFLGHGLAEPDVERVVRFSHGDADTPKSWAVQIPGRAPGWLEYWRNSGLDIVQEDLATFLFNLHRAVWNAGAQQGAGA